MSYQPPPGQGWPQQPQGGPLPAPQRPRKRHILRNTVGGIFALIVLIIIIVVVANGGGNGTPSASGGSTPPAAGGTTAPAVSTSSAPPAPQYSAAQEQAVIAAQGYLSDGQGFSRKGLIQQLSSPDGSGFSKHLADFAVDHVRVSWKHQAAIAAKGYASDGEGFSYAGLVQQLESPYGSDFTHSQAVYGAKAAGL